MLISDRQICQLLETAQCYIHLLNKLSEINTELLSKCGDHNRVYVARLVNEVVEQQSQELKEVK